jgi:hypothetical protein
MELARLAMVEIDGAVSTSHYAVWSGEDDFSRSSFFFFSFFSGFEMRRRFVDEVSGR